MPRAAQSGPWHFFMCEYADFPEERRRSPSIIASITLMSSSRPNNLDAPDAGFQAFINIVVRGIVAGSPPETILAQAEQAGPLLFAELIAPVADGGSPFRALARAIIDHVPRPELRYSTRKLPRPERNDRCDCGSGRKYKQCCGPLDHGLPFQDANLLPNVLAHLPRKRWAELASSAVDPLAVADAAETMLEDDDSGAAIALLAPWFKEATSIPARHEPLLDSLLTAYDQHGQPRKKQQLLKQALLHGDRVIRSSAHQRLATITADAGDFAQAWEHFRQAQRDDSDSPSLSHLEIVLLLSEGKPEQARDRARFWSARLTRLGADEYAGLIAFLREVATHGADALLNAAAAMDPALGNLCKAFDNAPALSASYHLRHGNDEDAGELTPAPALTKALREWQAHFPQEHPSLTFLDVAEHEAWDDPAPWLDLLHTRPVLWQSLEVLDDLVLALGVVENQGILPLRARLLERAQALLELNLQANHAQAKPLPWPSLGNRPALRLIAQRIRDDNAMPPSAQTVERMQWMLALNPIDNHGFRDDLLQTYLHHRQYEQALSLAARYPDDAQAGVTFGRVLALFALGRLKEASAALAEAHGYLPRIAPMLLAARPRKPKFDDGFVSYGGPDQAWIYRQDCRALWEAVPGALDWLRTSIR